MTDRKSYDAEHFIDKRHYLSRDFAEREEAHLWPRVWQVACREEEIALPGQYIAYDIIDESIVVTRTTSGAIRAYYNVCPHRGRRLVSKAGTTKEFLCGYHGWRWSLDGDNTNVVDKHDWAGCITDEELRLQSVKVDTWGGFVFINMDPDCEPLDAFLGPVKERCDKFEFEKLRYRWYKTVIFPANWKVVLEGFTEAYHVQQTHPQLLEFIEDYSNSGSYGRHGAFWYPPLPEGASRFTLSARLGREADPDTRKYVVAYQDEMEATLQAMVTPRTHQASKQLMSLLPETASSNEVLGKLRQLQREAAIADGAGWPEDLTPEYIQASRQDWHVFPNIAYLHSNIDGVLCYRSRPNGNDPDSCIFDIWSLVRYAPGKEPPLKREAFDDPNGVDFGKILNQDFGNLKEVQRGMKSRGFRGAIPNPVQEAAVSNFHRALVEFIEEGEKQA